VDWSNQPAGTYPGLPAFVIHLQPGDVLIQPPLTPHAPYTKENTIMSGTQHWHSRSMLLHIRAALFDRAHGKTTNEDEADEALGKFCLIRKWMLQDHSRWPWNEDEKQAYCEAIEVCPSTLAVNSP